MMAQGPGPGLNPFERIRSVEGKVALLMTGLALLCFHFELTLPPNGNWARIEVQVAAVALYIVLGTYGTSRIVARPVRRASRHFAAIGAGDYSQPVRTRRSDEFGDMLRGLEQMRRSLAAAIAARDAAERQVREILDRSIQGFFQSNAQGNLLAANDAMARMFGYSTKEALLAQPAGFAKRLYVNPHAREEFIRQMREAGFASGVELQLKHRDGSTVWIAVSARVVRDPSGGGEYWEGFIDDITERKESEQLKADFVSFVTHQLRTPLSGIRWMLELARAGESHDEMLSFIDDAHSSAERLIHLVNDLLDVARLEAGRLTTEPELVDMRALARDLVQELSPLALAKQQHVQSDDQDIPPVLADKQLLRQAALNLLANAIKYTPDFGRVRVTLRVDEEQVRFAVADTGIGIPETAQKRLFEKFYRADNAQVIDTEGTGLGLYLVRLIAERSGGTVTCQSVEGTGSTFTLSLPIAHSSQVAA